MGQFYPYETMTPLADALEAIIGKPAPDYISNSYNSADLTRTQQEKLEHWASYNARPFWATGGSIVDSANLMVERALENANLAPRIQKS